MRIDHETGLLSLHDSFTPSELFHEHDWLNFREPESHLEEFASTLVDRLPRRSRVAGVSWKDTKILSLLSEDSGLRVNLDAITLVPGLRQDSAKSQEAMASMAPGKAEDRVDVLIVRHLLEHADSLGNFLCGLEQWLSPGGRAIFEIPDCEPDIRACNYSMIWEEHFHYFTEDSFRRTLEHHRWKVEEVQRKCVDGEHLLLASALLEPAHSPPLNPTSHPKSTKEMTRFFLNFAPTRDRVREHLLSYVNSGFAVGLFGANHVASNFIDLFASPGLIDFCLDGSAEKQDRFLSRFSVPILAPQAVPLTSRILLLNAVRNLENRSVRRQFSGFGECGLEVLAVADLLSS